MSGYFLLSPGKKPLRTGLRPAPRHLEPRLRSCSAHASTFWPRVKPGRQACRKHAPQSPGDTAREGAVLTLWNSRRKERSYSPRQRSSILSRVTWCRVVVTASALTRSSRLSLCLGESCLRSTPHPHPAQTPRGSLQGHTAPRASRERYREDGAWQGTARPPQLASLPGLGHWASLCGSTCGSQEPKAHLLEAALKRWLCPASP